MKTLAIYGSGGLGREILLLATKCLSVQTSQKIEQIVWIDDIRLETEYLGYKCFPFEDFINHCGPSETQIVCAVGEIEDRILLRNRIENYGYRLATLVADNAIDSDDSIFEEGVVVFPNCILTSKIHLHKNVLVRTGVTLTHDDIIGENSVISHKATIAGSIAIGTNCYIGLGALIRDHVTIGTNCVIGMGAVVTKSAPAPLLSQDVQQLRFEIPTLKAYLTTKY